MKKLLQVFTLILLFSASASAQNYQWAKGIGDSNNETGQSVSTTDAGGNVYIAGYFAGVVDFDPGAGVFNLSSDAGSQDAYLLKLDPSGNFVWASAIGGSSTENITGLAVDASGYAFVCGSFYSSSFDVDPGVGTQYLAGGGGYSQAFIMKFDQSGGYTWAFAFGGGSADDYAMSIAIDASSNSYITGSYQGTVDFDPTAANTFLTANAGTDVFIMKVDPFGSLLWAKSVGGSFAETGNGIAVNSTGDVYVAGAFQGSVDFDPSGSTAVQASQGNDDAFLLKLDGLGNYQWAQVFGSITGLERGYSVTTDINGDVLIAGDFNDVTDFDPSGGSTIETPVGNFDCFVNKFDASGTFLWNKVWGSSTQDFMNCVAVDTQSNVYTTGSFSGFTDFDPSGSNYNLSPSGTGDLFISKLSSIGNLVWARGIGGANTVNGYGISVDPNYNVYVCGLFDGTPDFDPNVGTVSIPSNGASDAFILKLDQCNVATNAGVDQTICSGGSTILTANGANSFVWSTASTSAGILVSPIVTTTYWVTGTDFPGCSVNDTVVVYVNVAPIVSLGSDISGCFNGVITGVTSEPVTTYSWSSNPPFFSSSNPSETFNYYGGPVTYYLQATNAVTTCIATDSIVIDLYHVPNVALGSDIANCSNAVPNANIGVTSETNVNYSWSSIPAGFSSTNNQETVAPPTAISYILNAVDIVSGCAAADTVSIWIKPNPTLTLVGNFMNYACGGDSVRLTDILVAVGGTQPYAYDWWWGGGTVPDAGTNTMYYPTFAVTFSVGVVDANGCQQSGGATMSFMVNYNPTVSTDLVGHVVTPLPADVTDGLVYAFNHHPGSAGLDTAATVSLDANGKYVFTNLDNDDYLIKVVPDESTFPLGVPTYFGNTFQWDSSIVVSHGCVQVDTADIEILELPTGPGSIGTGFISGYVIEGPGFGNARLADNGGHQPNIPFAPGGPLKGVDVKLGKNPGGGIQARVMTDTSGYFEFDSLPLEGYIIYVDIPNLPMDSTRSVDLSSGPTVSVQNNYFADSTNVYIIDTVLAVGIHSSEKAYENNFIIFPNPAKDNLTIKFDATKAGDVNVILMNALGQNVYEERIKNNSAGAFTHSIEVSSLHLKAGVYFISVLNGGNKYTQRLVVVE